MKKFLVYTILLIAYNNYSFSEEKEFIIKCKNDNIPIIGTIITFNKNKPFFSDKNGLVKIPLINNTLYTIMAHGYKTIKIDYNELKNLDIILLSPDIFNLEQVVLTSYSDPQKIDKSIYNIKLINSDYLENLGANTLNDALRFQANTQITQDGILGSKISMQGMSGEHIKILIDGVPLIGRENGNIDLSQIDISNIEHIEIIEGPLSVMYGSNALGGTINIITKKDTIKNFSSYANAYYESVGQYNGKISGSTKFNNHYISADIGTNIFTGFDTDNSTRSVLFNPKKQYFINSNYTYKKNSFNFELGGNITRDNLTILGNFLDLYKNYANDINFITDRAILYNKVNFNLNEIHSFFNQISYSGYSRKKNTYYKDLINNNETKTRNKDDHDTTVFNNINARIILESKYNSLELQNGIDYNFDNGKGERIIGQKIMNDVAYWGNYLYKFSENFKVQPSIRITYNDNFSAPILYSFSAYWNDDDNYKIKFSTAKGFRTPSLKERYLNFVDANHKIFGNENLKPEHSYHFSSQFNYKRLLFDNMGITFDVSVFYNNLKDIIELSLKQNLDGTYTDSYTYNNIGNKITYGGNIFISSQKHKKYQAKIGIDFLNIGYRITNDFLSDNNFNFMAMFSYSLPYIETNINLDYKYNGKMILILSSGNTLSKGEREEYNMLNISLSRSFFNNLINLNIGLKNIFDVINLTSSRDGLHQNTSTPISWGRTFFTKLKIEIF